MPGVGIVWVLQRAEYAGVCAPIGVCCAGGGEERGEEETETMEEFIWNLYLSLTLLCYSEYQSYDYSSHTTSQCCKLEEEMQQEEEEYGMFWHYWFTYT